jgi:hypothetical protein
MFTFNTARMPLRRRLAGYGDHIQLAAWRQVIHLNRAAAKARLWLEPIKHFLWLPPIAFAIGLVVGVMSRLI